MNVPNWLFWGLVATLAQAVVDTTSVGLRLTRMSLPLMLGTLWTANRSKGKIIGFFSHLITGLIFTLFYVAAFHFLQQQSWWLGGLIGLAQAIFVLTVGMQFLPAFHPRMASEHDGPTAMRQLEPPGFLALNYGRGTPVSIAVSHVIFGIVIGAFCHA
jgi:hypothetical protein